MATPRTLPLFPPDPAAPAPPPRSRARLAPAVPVPPGPASQSRARSAQLWLALHLPRLALDCLSGGAVAAEAPDRSLAIVDPDDRLQKVLACNDAARAAGVRPGHALNAALALDARLLTVPRDAAREQGLLERIAAWCHRFTPLVSLAPPDELLLEVKGSLHLFGGARALMERIAREMRGRGIEVSLAIAPAPRGALWLARASWQQDSTGEFALVERPEELPRRLASVPLRCLRWPEEQSVRLERMGLRTVGELMRLPRAGFARRLGAQWLDELDRALGRRAETRRRFRPPERFDEQVSPECELETTAGVESAMTPLLAKLRQFLIERDAAIGALALRLGHRSGPPTTLRIGLAAPSSDTGHLLALFRERLASISLRAPVVALRLRSSALLDAIATPLRLPCATESGRAAFQATNDDALPRLLERLQARLGRAAVFGVSSCAEHRPERAWRAVDPAASAMPASPAAENTAMPSEPRRRPLWLLPTPQPLPDPRHAGWRIESGPERIESGWWDGHDVARDYFIARDPRGVRAWVFRDRREPGSWYRHGLFG